MNKKELRVFYKVELELSKILLIKKGLIQQTRPSRPLLIAGRNLTLFVIEHLEKWAKENDVRLTLSVTEAGTTRILVFGAVGAATGAAIGFYVGGPVGALVGGAAGALIGSGAASIDIHLHMKPSGGSLVFT